MGLCAGQRRVDLALVNGELTGYEIKSDEDTLRRLAGQSEAYGRVLDRAVLVTTERHVAAATTHLPEWWGVTTASISDGEVTLTVVREPQLNHQIDPFALSQLLWRDEAMEELRARNLHRGLSKQARHYVWVALAEALAIGELRDVVRARLKARREWSGDQ